MLPFCVAPTGVNTNDPIDSRAWQATLGWSAMTCRGSAEAFDTLPLHSAELKGSEKLEGSGRNSSIWDTKRPPNQTNRFRTISDPFRGVSTTIQQILNCEIGQPSPLPFNFSRRGRRSTHAASLRRQAPREVGTAAERAEFLFALRFRQVRDIPLTLPGAKLTRT